MSLRSVPPPPTSEPSTGEVRAPLLRKCGVQPLREQARDVLRAWVTRRRVSERDLVASTGKTKKIVADVLDAEAGWPVEMILAQNDRDALDLLDELRDLVRARSRRTA